jgi:very-short-patch-repair endonuclease
MPRRPLVPSVALDQDGLFTYPQALAAGWSPYRIRRLLAVGQWTRVVGPVLAAATTVPTYRRRSRAATLATGGVLSHEAGLVLWGFPDVAPSPPLHVSVASCVQLRVPGIRLHRRAVEPQHCTVRYGIPVTTRDRAVVDCALAWPRPRAADLLDRALRERWVTLDILAAHVREARGRHGVPQLRELVADAWRGTRSEAERALARILDRAGIRGWRTNQPMTLPDGTAVEIDVWFPEQRLAVEVDGLAWHVTPERFRGDRVRQNRLVLAGITVLRFTWADLTTAPDRVAVTVERARARLAG